MAGVWVVLTLLAIFIAAPGLFVSFHLAERRAPSQLRAWFTALAVINGMALIIGILAMPKG